MSLQSFIDKYNGKFVEYHSFDPRAKNQCVDLVNQYIVEVLNLPAIIGTNAQDFPKKAEPHFQYIPNTPEGIPLPGDLMIFKSADGVGHISIYLTGSSAKFTSFDQNYPVGSPCRETNHIYKNVLGWMRPKKENMSNTTLLQECESKLAWFEKEYPIEQQRVTDARAERDDYKKELENYMLEAKKTISDLKTEKQRYIVEADLQREALKDLVAWMASTLDTTQETPRIKAKVAELIEIEDLLTRERKESTLKDETIQTQVEMISELRMKTEQLEQDLKEAKGLHSAQYSELFEAIIAKFINDIKRKL